MREITNFGGGSSEDKSKFILKINQNKIILTFLFKNINQYMIINLNSISFIVLQNYILLLLLKVPKLYNDRYILLHKYNIQI